MKYVWMKVSADKYELPLVIADTSQALANKCGVHVNTIMKQIEREKKGLGKSIYKKVEVEERTDDGA